MVCNKKFTILGLVQGAILWYNYNCKANYYKLKKTKYMKKNVIIIEDEVITSIPDLLDAFDGPLTA